MTKNPEKLIDLALILSLLSLFGPMAIPMGLAVISIGVLPLFGLSPEYAFLGAALIEPLAWIAVPMGIIAIIMSINIIKKLNESQNKKRRGLAIASLVISLLAIVLYSSALLGG